VTAAIAASSETDLADGLHAMALSELPLPLRPMDDAAHWTRHSIATLLYWLEAPAAEGKDDRALLFSKQAGATAFRMVPDPRKSESSTQRAQLEQFWKDLPGTLPYERPVKPVASGNLTDPLLTFRYWISQALADPEAIAPKSPGFLVIDQAAAESEPEQHLAWRCWLWMFNTLQHLPGVFLATRDGLLGADHNHITPAESANPASGGGQAAEAAGWAQVMDQAMEFLLPGLRELQTASIASTLIGPNERDRAESSAASPKNSYWSKKIATLAA
jgi:DEAD/DEAH box helicase domain-containing protein